MCALDSGMKLLKTPCGQHEDVRIVSTDNTMVIELNVLGKDVPGRRFFEGRYYQCNGLFALPDSDIDSDSDSNCKPNDYIVPCRTSHSVWSQIQTQNPNCQLQERDWSRNPDL